MTTRRVLVVHPGAEMYGSDRVMLESVDGFLEAGMEVVVVLSDPGPLAIELERRGVTVHTVALPVLRKSYLRPLGLVVLALRSLITLPRVLATMRRSDADVVYTSTLTVPIVVVVSRVLRLPVIIHVHEAEPSAPRLIRVGLVLPLLLAHRIVANSEFSAEVLRESIPRVAARCVVVPNGVVGPREPVPPRHDLDGVVRLLFLGRISERKGIFEAVDAVAELRRRGIDVHLDVVGSVFRGYESVATSFDRRIHDLGIGGHVTRHGFDADVWPHLARTDVVLVPSRRAEPFGNTAVEGALAARPLVVSRCGGLPEATGTSRAACLVPPGSPTAIADAVEDVIGRWPTMRRWALEDRTAVADRFACGRYRRAIADEVVATAGSAFTSTGRRPARRRGPGSAAS